MQQTLEQSKSGKSLIKQLFTALLATSALIAVSGYFFIRLQFEPSLFRQPFYRLSHHVLSVEDIGSSYSRREVAVTLGSGEKADAKADAKAEALACVRAFEIRSLQDGQTLTCRVFQNGTTSQHYQDGEQGCMIAEAIQTPYGRAATAEARMNPSFYCGN